MKPQHVVGIILFMLVAVALWCVVRVHTATTHLATTVARCAAQRADLQRCAAAGILSSVGMTSTSSGDLVAQLQRTLTSAGIASTAFRGVQPLADHSDLAARVIEHSVQVHFEGLRPSDLGAWLAVWCVPGQGWEVMDITWSHPPYVTGGIIDNGSGLASVALRLRSPL